MASTPTSGDDVIFGTTSGDTIDALGGDDVILAVRATTPFAAAVAPTRSMAG